MAEPKKTKKNNNENALPIFAKMNATSLAAFSAFAIVLVSLVFYTSGFSAALNDSDNSPETNMHGLAYNYEPVERAYCLLYSDEVVVSETPCSIPADCAPNGICYEETETCMYFIN